MRRSLALAAALAVLGLTSSARAEDGAAPDARPTPVRLRAFGGVAHGSLFGLPVTGPSGGGGVGGGVRRSWGGADGFGDLTYDALSTEHGVGVHRLAFGASGEVYAWHVRAGAGVDLGMAWLARLSASNESARRVYVGAHATLGVDLFTAGGVTPYLQGRAEYSTAFPTFGASGGVRYAF
ncbi:MAG: hypothetical protein U0270_28985 [Labilithrix sp.]